MYDTHIDFFFVIKYYSILQRCYLYRMHIFLWKRIYSLFIKYCQPSNCYFLFSFLFIMFFSLCLLLKRFFFSERQWYHFFSWENLSWKNSVPVKMLLTDHAAYCPGEMTFDAFRMIFFFLVQIFCFKRGIKKYLLIFEKSFLFLIF